MENNKKPAKFDTTKKLYYIKSDNQDQRVNELLKGLTPVNSFGILCFKEITLDSENKPLYNFIHQKGFTIEIKEEDIEHIKPVSFKNLQKIYQELVENKKERSK